MHCVAKQAWNLPAQMAYKFIPIFNFFTRFTFNWKYKLAICSQSCTRETQTSLCATDPCIIVPHNWQLLVKMRMFQALAQHYKMCLLFFGTEKLLITHPFMLSWHGFTFQAFFTIQSHELLLACTEDAEFQWHKICYEDSRWCSNKYAAFLLISPSTLYWKASKSESPPNLTKSSATWKKDSAF